MAKLHGFARPMGPITEFDGEDLVSRPKYVRQLAMVDEESRMPDPVKPDPVETKENSYDITVTVSTTSRLYEKYKWNEDRIHRLEAFDSQICKNIVRFFGSHGCRDLFAEWRPDGYF